ncbi:MAG: hypothetical protein J6D26_01200 [Clostridia bacterium]|nr:hypothetical protein [Clostridia bacterium]
MNKDIIEKVKNTVALTYRKAAKLSGEAIDYTKIKLKISELNAKLDDKYAQIGIAVYESDETADIDSICSEIADLKEQINDLNIKLCEFKNQKTCSLCGKNAEKDAEYCPGCGNKF